MIERLIEKCIKSIEKLEITAITNGGNKCSSWTLYIVLFSVIFLIKIGIIIFFVYFCWYLKRDDVNG